jgi:hypothetical protein
MTPDETRTMYSGLWAKGVKAILTSDPTPDHFICHWTQKIVCEDYTLADGERVPTLEDNGRAYALQSGWLS